MKISKRLAPDQLYRQCDTAQFTFETTAELEPAKEAVGQQRAYDAIRFGIGIRREGYNLFALGPPGTGKHAITRQFIEARAASEPVPNDWCYLNNFENPAKPLALSLPAGMGVKLRHDMVELVEDLRSGVPLAFEGDEYLARRHDIDDRLKERQELAFEELRQEAESHGQAMLRTPNGLAFAPMHDGKVLESEEYEKLSEKKHEQINQVAAILQERLENIFKEISRWRHEAQLQVRQLNRDSVMAVVEVLVEKLKKTYADQPSVLAYLSALQADVVDNAHTFRRHEEHETHFPAFPLQRTGSWEGALRRYQVNVLVDHSETQGAPVVYLDNPNYHNLIGRLEHQAEMGALLTDFAMIKPGALHRANGGYLLLDAHDVLSQPFVWEALKRALRAREIVIEALGQAYSLISMTSLEPQPIPLSIKIVLLGEPLLYYLLCDYDPDFRELFKVTVDFDYSMEWGEQNTHDYARLIAALAQKESLRPLHVGAVARVIEHAARQVEDAGKLSTRFGHITDLLREADYWAGEANDNNVHAEHVQQAIDARVRRHGRIQEAMQDEIRKGVLMIDADGAAIGQVNALSVMEVGDYSFGHPSRITARVRLGKGDVLDIEREIEMGGPIHSKGVMILTGYLGGRYALHHHLSLSASLVFEQTYGGVDGDSASLAELCSLLSALAEIPVKQSLAVTGSINQHGQVQAVGGVNEKIEGFFDLCLARGLTGEQGAIIPAVNQQHLMLRKDVVQAVADGKFHIYTVAHVDEAMELFTGMTAGVQDQEGRYPEGSLNDRIDTRLVVMAQQAHAHDGGEEDENDSAS